MVRPSLLWATPADVEAARDEVLRVIAEAERNIGLERSAASANRGKRAREKVILGGVILLLSGLGSFALFGAATQQLPMLANPGRIGVALVDAQERGAAAQVHVTFDATEGRGTAFRIAVTDWESGANRPLRVAVYFCGAIRDGLHLKELNSAGELRLKKLEQSLIEQDSLLGARKDCRYVLAESGSGYQVLIAGNSTNDARVDAASGIAFAFPGLTTIPIEEPLGTEIAWPLQADSKISVAVGNPPADLRISTARPQLPQSGTLEWVYPVSPINDLPNQYRISGSLQQQETVVQAQLFAAGSLAGIAGAALLWTFELLLDLPRHRFRPDRASAVRGLPGAPHPERSLEG